MELAVEPRLVVGLCRVRPFSFDDLLGRALADLLLALASLFIVSTRTLRTRHRSGGRKHRLWATGAPEACPLLDASAARS